MNHPTTPHNPLQGLIAAAQADPKKATLLVILVAVMVILWSRAAGGTSPRSADGALTPRSAAPLAGAAPSKLAPSPASTGLNQWLRGPIRPTERNLFSIKLDYYRQDPAIAKPVLRAPTGDGFWDLLAKSMIARADQRKEKQILIENLQLQAAQLRLQTTLMGSQPRAMINNGLACEGDIVAGFRVLKIEARRVIVEREGVKLEILMK